MREVTNQLRWTCRHVLHILTCLHLSVRVVLCALQGDIGLNVAKMIAELIRDNRKIVDRITQEQIELFVGLLKLNKVRCRPSVVLHKTTKIKKKTRVN